MGVEIGAIAGGVGLDRRVHRLGRLVGGVQDQRFGLGADDVVGGGDAAGGEVGKVRTGGEGAFGVARAKVEHGEVRGVGQDSGQRAAQGGERGGEGRGRQGGGGDERGGAAVGQPCLDEVGVGDDAVIAELRIRSPGEMAVVDEEEALGIGVLVKGVGGGLGQCETGHDVWDKGQAVAEEFARGGGDLGQVGEDEEGSGVGVVHDLVRNPGVQERLDRGLGRRGRGG